MSPAEFAALGATAERLRKLASETNERPLNDASYAPERAATDGIAKPDLSCAETYGDVRNGRVFAQKWRGQLLYIPTRDKWLLWRDERWQPCEKGEEIECAKAACGELIKVAQAALRTGDISNGNKLIREAELAHNLPRINAMLRLASSETGMSALEADLDADPMLLGVQNGVVDLRTGLLQPNQPELLITRYCEANFDPLAQCPRWLEFLTQVFEGDTETIESVQRLLGYTLTGLVTEEVMVICYGHGSNGKSVFSNVVHRILAGYSRTAPSSMLATRRPDDTGPRNDLAAIAGARCVPISELQAGDRLDEQSVKLLAGREPISARFLFKELFEYTPTAKIWLRTNHKPIVNGEDDGIWRRLVLLPFKRKFTDEEKDPGLEDALMAERDGILQWCVEGAGKYLQDGLKLSQLIRREHSSYRNESDLLGEFLAELTDFDLQRKVLQSDLFAAWQYWCATNGIQVGSKKRFTQRLGERGIAASKSNGSAYYAGISIKGPTQQGGKGGM